MYLDPFVRYSPQKQNLLVCKEWYNAFLRLDRYIKDPEFIDWIRANHEVLFTEKYENAKYRIADLISRKVKVSIETGDANLPNIFHNITISSRKNIKICKNIVANKLSVITKEQEKNVEIHNCSLNTISMEMRCGYFDYVTIINSTIQSSHLSIYVYKLQLIDVEINTTYLRLDVAHCIRLKNCVIKTDILYFDDHVPKDLVTGGLGINTKIYARVVYMDEGDYMWDEIERSVIGLEEIKQIFFSLMQY